LNAQQGLEMRADQEAAGACNDAQLGAREASREPADHRYMYIALQPEHAGHTLFVDDREAEALRV